MILGLAGGLGFYLLKMDGLSPTRMFHGRTVSLESDFCRNAGIAFTDRPEPDDERAWRSVRERLDAGRPVMVATDTYYLGYHRTTSHFPLHRCVVVGYDEAERSAWMADRKFEEFQRCSLEELRRARNAPNYPISCENQWGDFHGGVALGRPLEAAIWSGLAENARSMLEPDAPLPAGIPALRALAREFPEWAGLEDWSWAARFGYQVVVKRGSGGSFFRSLYAEFLREAAKCVPEIGEAGLPERMECIAGHWRELAGLLKQQSEREVCEPALFAGAGRLAGRIADAEEGFFAEVARLTAGRGAVTARGA
jgi:hypothetical protein